MPSDLERQVAEAKCPACQGHKRTKLLYSEGPCEPCNETGLRFPALSRECQGNIPPAYIYTINDGQIYNLGRITDHEYPKGTVYHCRSIDVLEWRTREWVDACNGGCNGSGRVPDVTTDKVLDIFADMGVAFHFTYGTEGRGMWLKMWEGAKTHWAETWKDAAIAVLLANVINPASPVSPPEAPR